MGTLVGGKASGEADKQGVGVDFVEEAHNARGVALVLQPIFTETGTDVVDELRLELHARVPNHFVGHVVDAFPDALVALILHKGLVEVFVIDGLPLLSAPRGEVYAVGDVAYVALFWEVASPDAVEHLLADFAVEPADTVDFLASFAEEGAHAELLALVVRVGASEAHEVVPADAEFFGHPAEVFTHEPFFEVVVACRYGGVDGVEAGSTHEFHSFAEAVAFLHVVEQTLHVAEGGMAFVAVVDVLLDAELLQGEHATNAEEVLLLKAALPLTAVEGVGDVAVVLAVFLNVGVEEVEGDAAHVGFPDGGVDNVVGEGHVNDDLVAILIEHALNGQLVEVLCLVVGNLLAVHRESLCEVAIAIEETYATHIYVGVAGFFEVVASEDAETATIDFQNMEEAELHAEVSYAGALLVGLHVHIVAEQLIDFVHTSHKFLVFCQFLEAVVLQATEHFNGVLVGSGEEFAVDATEEVAAFYVPRPPEVASHLVELLQLAGDMALDVHHVPLGFVGITDLYFHLGVYYVCIYVFNVLNYKGHKSV